MTSLFSFRGITLFITGVVSLICLPTLLLFTAHAESPLLIQKTDNDSKILRMESEDTITLQGAIYNIPSPWRGYKVQETTYSFEHFALIPLDATHNESKLYLLRDAQKALVALLEEARKAGLQLKIHSAYRSRSYQRNIFHRMLAEGRTFDDIIRYVAPPGYSEHALGTVVDFYPSNWQFAEMEAYGWLKENALSFGFSETYPEKNAKGQPWEPWHWRFTTETEHISPLVPEEKQLPIK